ncbi:hypothetical protein PTSG_03030 [Salpingoeca rosetta]|uniref:protein O-GlcNAcase n=1 Tax=Salpingoeca rosetta (strain ATCC 50818 / BSB-021) TaxID=946362 RepID=F2U419_SALR5|nr:uncharacterized protein PTSG_03030 [Salpingoeca rosetta]EGD82363.1 hypothetical protein PTSG_03030 [Salpingoeca rosetta]|eukprot:XP_004996546.1 hypothetical protein PTSG_03030 [Salpingoeca rosetta]
MTDNVDAAVHPWMLGVVEGFYGRPWQMHQRSELFTLLNHWGMNAYVYAPKDDHKHRAFWRQLYTDDELARLSELIAEARRNNVEFIYAISPGLSMVYSSDTENKLLHDKLSQVHELGCTSFAILFDDIDKGMCTEDHEAFESLAHAHCEVANRILSYIGPRRLLFCPTEYCTSRADPSIKDSAYLSTVGHVLDPAIQVLWTGDAVIPEYITPESLAPVNAAIRRKCVIWDNIHANDYDPRRVYLGPYAGRPHQLREHVDGVLTNPNCEYTSNFVALHTMAAWHNLGPAYDPRVAYRQAITDWLPRLVSRGQQAAITAEAMVRLCDMFYLPYQHGSAASTFIANFLWLEDTPTTDEEWSDRCNTFREECTHLVKLCKTVCALSCDLARDLYRYLWDLQEMLSMLCGVLDRLSSPIAFRPTRTARPSLAPSLAFGGMLATLHQLVLPYGAEHGTSICTSHRIYAMRPCFESDRDYLYDLCIKAGRAGADPQKVYECPTILGDRWVGPYLSLPGCLAYVLEDNQGVCGYVLAAIDSRAFYRDLQSLYLPSVAGKYTPPAEPRSNWKPVDHLLHELLNPTFYIDEDIMKSYPSHLHIDLLPRAQNQGNGRRLINLLLRNLQACGSVGVHLEVPAESAGAHRFYERLGFSPLSVNMANKVYFGKTWASSAPESQPDAQLSSHTAMLPTGATATCSVVPATTT